MLVVIPFDLPWVHTADYAHQTATELAKHNVVVCYMQKEAKSIREYLFSGQKKSQFRYFSSNIYHYYPIYIIPFRRFYLIEKINTFLNIFLLKILLRRHIKQFKRFKKLLWLFYPDYRFMVEYFGKSFESIYDCVDYHGLRNTREESLLIAGCKYCFVNSRVLFNIHKTMRKDIVLVPQGFRLKDFQTQKKTKSTFAIPHPVIGYVGGINSRLDIALLSSVAKTMQHCSFVLVGPIQEKNIVSSFNKLSSQSNVYWLDYQAKASIPSIIQAFDVCMIPYKSSNMYNARSFPMKLFEYFYMGKPVISTPLEELKKYSNYVKMGATVQEWEEHISSLLSKPWPKSYKKKQRKLAAANSWEKKIDKILRVIESD